MDLRRNENGLTLVELIVTMLISSILLSILGAIIVAANAWWIRSQKQMASLDEMRYATKRMGFLLRNAAYVVPNPHHAFVTTANGRRLEFNNGASSIELQDDKLIHTNQAGQTEVLLQDVARADMHVISEDCSYSHIHLLNCRQRCCLVATLVTEKDAPNGEIIRSSTTCFYKSRNNGL